LSAFLAQMVTVYLAEIVPVAHPLAVTLTAMTLAAGAALLAVRTGAILTGVFLALELLAVVALVVAGVWHHPAGNFISMLVHPRIPDATATGCRRQRRPWRWGP